MERGQSVVELVLALMLVCLVALFILFIVGEGKPVEMVKKLWDALKEGGAISVAFGSGIVFIPRWLAPEPERQLFGIGRRGRRRILWVGWPPQYETWEPDFYGSLGDYLFGGIKDRLAALRFALRNGVLPLPFGCYCDLRAGCVIVNDSTGEVISFWDYLRRARAADGQYANFWL